VPTRSETSKSGAEGGRGGPSTADQLEYMADLIRELQGLAEQRAISQKEFQDATSAAEFAAASLAGAEARVAEAQLNLSYTVVRAPISGSTTTVKRRGLVGSNNSRRNPDDVFTICVTVGLRRSISRS